MADLFLMKGEQMTWFVNKELNVEGLAVRRNDIFMVHLSHMAASDTDISQMAFDGVSVDRFKGKIFLSDSKKMIICEPFGGMLPANSIVLLQHTIF